MSKDHKPSDDTQEIPNGFLPQELLAERAIRINERVGLKAHRKHKQLERGIGYRNKNQPNVNANTNVMDFAQRLAGDVLDEEHTPTPAKAPQRKITPDVIRAHKDKVRKEQAQRVAETVVSQPPVAAPVLAKMKPTAPSNQAPASAPEPTLRSRAPRPVHVSGGEKPAKEANFGGTGSDFNPEVTQVVKKMPKKPSRK